MSVQPASFNPSLIIAASQLKEVQDIIGAMRAADKASGKSFSVLGIALDRPAVIDQCYRQPVVCQDPKYLPRRVIQPTPRYLPRPVIHLTPRIEFDRPKECLPEGSAAVVPILTQPPPPPWKSLPWPKTEPLQLKVKVTEYRPDTKTKGMLIDLFV